MRSVPTGKLFWASYKIEQKLPNPIYSQKHVKPALEYAVNTIDLEEDFLEDYKFELEYGDSKCNKDAKLTACDMYYNSLQQGKFDFRFFCWVCQVWKSVYLLSSRIGL